MTIYEIDKAIEQMLINGFVFNEETGEVDMLLTPKTLDMMLDDKLEDYGLFIKSLKADTDAITNEIKTLQARKKQKEKLADRLSDTLLKYMEKHDKKKIETPKLLVSTRNSSKVIIDDEEALMEYCRINHKDDCYSIKIEQKPIKANIKKQIADFEGMAHVETNKTINIK